MRQRIEVQTDIGTQDSYGQTTHDWTTDICLRAKIETLRGAEGELARQIYPHATHRVTTEYHTDLNSTGATRRRVKFGTRALHIGAIINPDEESFHLELLCGEER